MYYKAGRLYFAQTTLLNDNNGHHEGIYWAEVQPQLTTKAAHTPQWVNGAVVTQVAYFDFGSTYDLYDPTLMGTDEGDITLVYNISGSTLYPRIEMTGRKATDAPNTLGQGGHYVLIANGTHTQTMSAFGAEFLLRHPAQLGDPWHDLVRRTVHRVGAGARLEYAPLQLPRRVAILTQPTVCDLRRGTPRASPFASLRDEDLGEADRRWGIHDVGVGDGVARLPGLY